MALSKGLVDKLRKKAEGTKYTTKQLMSVYKRGLGAYSSGGSRPGMTAHQWAMARVNSFIKGGHKQDDDLKK